MHLFHAGLVFVLTASTALAADHELAKAEKPPEKGVAKEIAAMLDPAGYALKGGDGVLAEFWFVKQPPLADTPSTMLGVNYQFTPGQLLGVMRVPEGADYSDFREQEIDAGVYTLRYGRQPMDGNHIGTSETADFLLALPAKMDQSTKPLDYSKLTNVSAKSVSASHPAIFSLLPPGKAPEQAQLKKAAGTGFQVLELPLKVKAGDATKTQSFRLIVVGHTDA